MTPRNGAPLLAAAAILLLAGCGGDDEAKKPADGKDAPAPLRPGVEPGKVAELLGPMNRGLAHLERYDYGSATGEFREAAALAPGFYPARLNLAVALLNLQKEPESVERELRAAAELAPSEAAPHYLLGIHLTQGVSPPRTEEAEAAFARAIERAPEDADAHHRRGLALKELGRNGEAEEEFTRALERNPFLGAALYQRGMNRRQIGKDAEGLADLEAFEEMKVAGRVDEREISYGFMGPLGAAARDLDRWLPPAEPVEAARVVFTEKAEVLDDPADPGGTVAAADLDRDGVLDLVFSTLPGAGGLPGWRPGLGGWKFGPARPFPKLVAVPSSRHLAVADFDNDARTDVVVAGYGFVLAAGGEEPRAVADPHRAAPGRRLVADLDADGDLDLVAGRTVLLNDGKAAFTPSEAAELPAEPWEPLLLRDVDDDGFPDLVGEGSWVRNLRGGAFGGARPVGGELAELVRLSRSGMLVATGDVDADGIDDAVQAVGEGVVVVRGLPPGTEPMEGHPAPGYAVPQAVPQGRARASVLADLDGDGDLDLLLAQGGRLRFLVNAGDAGPRTLVLRLRGVLHPNGKQWGWTNPMAIGARVEAFFGRHRVARTVGFDLGLEGRPPPDLAAFGLGPGGKADLVSIRWTEGVIQAEPEVEARPGGKPGVVVIEEVQRKAASCPVVFAWDGETFAFVADCMGGGGLGFLVAPGAPGAPGVYGAPDPTERVRIESLVPREGFYEVRLLEPLEEVCYADRLALTAVDHPAGTEAYPDERFGGIGDPPGERVFVHRVAERILPGRAVDSRGEDCLDALARRDRVYAEGFDLHRNLLGFTAADHWIDLDFGDRVPAPGEGERLVLFLDGWIEYGYSRTFYAAAGAGVEPLSPTLEVPDGKGGWRTAVADIGYPAGTPRTMTRDLTGVIGPGASRFRIRTNLEIYWDRVWLAVDRGEGSVVRTTAAPAAADLRFAGFPREVSPDGRHPKVNDYRLMDPGVPGFKVMAGEYTRYGDVLPLVREADDRFVVFRNGEEVALRFRVSDFPPLPEGRVRTFLLDTEGWCKDMDPYTATPATVGPLPFRAMTAYPPPAGEDSPHEGDGGEWRREYNTRRVR